MDKPKTMHSKQRQRTRAVETLERAFFSAVPYAYALIFISLLLWVGGPLTLAVLDFDFILLGAVLGGLALHLLELFITAKINASRRPPLLLLWLLFLPWQIGPAGIGALNYLQDHPLSRGSAQAFGLFLFAAVIALKGVWSLFPRRGYGLVSRIGTVESQKPDTE